MKKILSLLVCIFLVVSWFSISINFAQVPAGDGFVVVDVPPRGTFLKAMNSWPYYGPGDYIYDIDLEILVGVSTNYSIEAPAIVDLTTHGFKPGDKIVISHNSTIYHCGALNPSNPANTACGERKNDDIYWGGLLGLFSSTSELRPINELHRVPGAIASNRPEFKTPPTKWDGQFQKISDQLQSKNVNWYTGPMETDIPEDFQIRPYTGITVTIPQNAKYLFLSCIDDLYRANMGEIKVTIEKDSDEDGLPDSWEKNGIDINDDNVVDLDLPALGARWDRKDIFVEIDYMGPSGGHDHRPNIQALNDVIDAFDKAPVKNPGPDGINLHVIEFIDEQIPHQDEIDVWIDFDNLKKLGTQADRNSNNKDNILAAKRLVFHYCLFAHLQKGKTASGRGEIPGNDFIVSLGAFTGSTGNREEQAGTFMHELGHNLGLLHGGADNIQYKPNYLSVMNYLYQIPSSTSNLFARPLTFSSSRLADLSEKSLNEAFGIGTAPWAVTIYSGLLQTSSGTSYVPLAVSTGGAIDWDNDGDDTETSVAANINNFPQWNYNSPSDELLEGHNDWRNLVYRFRTHSNSADGIHLNTSEDELTFELAEAIKRELSKLDPPEPSERSEPINSIGVKTGDWMEWSVTYVGNPPDDRWHKIRIDVEDVQEDNVTLRWDVDLLNGESTSFTETSPLQSVTDFMIIGANLEVGDYFYHEQTGNIVIDFIEDYSFAGEERTVIGTVTSSGVAIHWDKITGVTTQSEWTSSDGIKTKWLLEKTNLWGSTGTGLDLIIFVGLIVAVAAILVIVLLFVRRKNKKTQITPV